MAKLSHRAARVVAAGKLMYGDTRWQSPLARLTGLSPALLQKIADGTREVTDDVYFKIADALLTEAARMHKSVMKVEEMAGRMFAELQE
ncbi:hypothetical protein BSZ19_18470 [Bradyrhizobium japonicum]|uniref:Uncharacterized protein n=1 Tax=Bradyrhizobium japonicum TaxID=375 RepID=A0A1Y2JQ24_BRAJP|nr:helix-turn-helix transcriptional regulator [Bradyrhizobium japonicum]OSJ32538.1 hypothetical protein BSZ19_18470 [Bradyrhizobium japonicum]